MHNCASVLNLSETYNKVTVYVSLFIFIELVVKLC